MGETASSLRRRNRSRERAEGGRERGEVGEKRREAIKGKVDIYRCWGTALLGVLRAV